MTCTGDTLEEPAPGADGDRAGGPAQEMETR
jgi:hypothetical protein